MDGRVAVVTGGASGIGLGMAEAFADAGCKLVLVDTNESRLAVASAALSSTTEVMTQVVDVRDEDQVVAMADAVYRRFGAANILCNNAGVATSGLTWEQTEDDWRWIFETNVLSVLLGVRVFVPRMLEGGEECHIVNTSSMLGLSSAPTTALYGSSKQAVLGISEALRLELMIVQAPIGVSVLCPGPVRTNVAEERHRPNDGKDKVELTGTFREVDEAIKAAVLGGMSPREVGDCVVTAVRGGLFWALPEPDLTNAEQRLTELRAAVGQG